MGRLSSKRGGLPLFRLFFVGTGNASSKGQQQVLASFSKALLHLIGLKASVPSARFFCWRRKKPPFGVRMFFRADRS
jgi:hypothetical protein